MANFEIRDATRADLLQWYEGPPPVSMRAQVLDVRGKILAVWGIQSTKGQLIGFASMKPEVKGMKKAIVAGIKKAKELLRDYPYVVAFADKSEPTAESFIQHIGFRHQGSSQHGEVYVWQIS